MSEAKPQDRERKSRSGPSSGSFTVARVQVQELAALAGPEVFQAPASDLLSDELIVDRVLHGEPQLFEILMRRVSARLYRIARGIVGTELEAEDVVRQAFVRAYENLSAFDRHLRFGDWLSRIAIHGALGRLKRSTLSPERSSDRRPAAELLRQLENAVDALPQAFRVAFTLCVLDQMPLVDGAEALGISPDELRLQAFRARLRVRRKLGMRFDEAEPLAFGLHLSNSDQMIAAALARLGVAKTT